MHIGREEREIIVEPLVLPIPQREPAPLPDAPAQPIAVPDEEETHVPA